jgi:hypothetical protein
VSCHVHCLLVLCVWLHLGNFCFWFCGMYCLNFLFWFWFCGMYSASINMNPRRISLIKKFLIIVLQKFRRLKLNREIN